MAKKLLGSCPVCDSKIVVSELKCTDCDTRIQGEFALSKFDYLTPEQQEFTLIFIKNAGNIKAIEKELNISYPTIKKKLDDVIKALGFDTVTVVAAKMTKQEILSALKRKEITFEAAEKLLKEVEE